MWTTWQPPWTSLERQDARSLQQAVGEDQQVRSGALDTPRVHQDVNQYQGSGGEVHQVRGGGVCLFVFL